MYYTINQNGVMRILNDKAAKQLNYIDLIRQKRSLHPVPPPDPKRLKIIFQKPTIGEDPPESYLTKRQPEMMDPFKITQDCQVIGAFMDDSTEFVPLDRWIMESNTFNILRNYKFFREYYARRAIDQWIAFRKYRQFCKNRAEISFVSFTGKKKFLQF